MLTPDILFDSYRDITPAFLQSQGVTLLLTDLRLTILRPLRTLHWHRKRSAARMTPCASGSTA